MRFALLLLFWGWIICLSAQVTPPAGDTKYRNANRNVDSLAGGFGAKQTEMLALLDRQLPRLDKMEETLRFQEQAVYGIDSVMKVPRRIAVVRDSAMNLLVRVRKTNDVVRRQLRDLHFEWFAYSLDLQAVYTRYGELISLRRDDDGLREFYRRYRDHFFRMQGMVRRADDVYNTSEYLLNAKLN